MFKTYTEAQNYFNLQIIKLGVSDLERIARKLRSAKKVTQRVIQERFRSICSSRPTPYARGTTTPILNPKGYFVILFPNIEN